MDDTRGSRRGFIAAAAATVTAIGALAATPRFPFLYGRVGNGGTITMIDTHGVEDTVPGGAKDVWSAAVGSAVRIMGEYGIADGRIVSVADGAMGGVRPASLRPEALIVYFEVDQGMVPLGDKIYGIISPVASVRELFLTRGDDVMGKAVMLAVLN